MSWCVYIRWTRRQKSDVWESQFTCCEAFW